MAMDAWCWRFERGQLLIWLWRLRMRKMALDYGCHYAATSLMMMKSNGFCDRNWSLKLQQPYNACGKTMLLKAFKKPISISNGTRLLEWPQTRGSLRLSTRKWRQEHDGSCSYLWDDSHNPVLWQSLPVVHITGSSWKPLSCKYCET